jgi:hypothetical protein
VRERKRSRNGGEPGPQQRSEWHPPATIMTSHIVAHHPLLISIQQVKEELQ